MRRLLMLSMIFLIFSLAIGTKAEAGLITGDEALGGMSKAIDDYYQRTGKGPVDMNDLRLLSAAMELENGCNSDECLLLTGSVILNRAYYCSWCPDSIEGVLRQNGQYSKHTVDNLATVKVPERVRLLAIHLLIRGPYGPNDMVYQAMFPQGTVYKKVDTEYFGREVHDDAK